MTFEYSGQKTFERLPLYFDDLDAFGMVHHAKFAVLLDRGTSSFWRRLGFRLGDENSFLVVRELTLTYEHPLRKAHSVDLRLWPEKVGTTSLILGFRFETADVLHAHGRRVDVRVDSGTGKPTPWSDETRRALRGALSPSVED